MSRIELVPLLLAVTQVMCMGQHAIRPNECLVSEWLAWGECTLDFTSFEYFGRFTRSRTRNLISPPGSGYRCPVAEKETCQSEFSVDCLASDWSDYSTCIHLFSLGRGVRVRTRDILIPEAHGGRGCGDLEQVEECQDGHRHHSSEQSHDPSGPQNFADVRTFLPDLSPPKEEKRRRCGSRRRRRRRSRSRGESECEDSSDDESKRDSSVERQSDSSD